MVSRTLLAVLLLAAIGVERYMPTARQPSKETAAGLLVVALAAYMTSAAFLAAPAAPVAHAANLLSRPWDLLPTALFLIAAVCFRQRSRTTETRRTPPASSITLSLSSLRSMLSATHRRYFHGSFSMAVFSGGVEQDVQLCGHAFRRVAGSGTPIRAGALDGRYRPLTGLSNYRRLISVLEAELDRSRRTQRPFSVVLFDMDGLKIITISTDTDGQPLACAYRQDSAQPFPRHRHGRAVRWR